MQRITPDTGFALHGIAATRRLEQLVAEQLPAHALMQRAGLAVARLALAIAPHARHIWIACGPGNNGGDGFEAGLHLHQAGKTVTLTWTGHPDGETGLPEDARTSLARARAAGLELCNDPPQTFDLGIDALLGLGGRFSADPPTKTNASSARMLTWLTLLRHTSSPVLAIDSPTGLNADTGADVPPPDAMNSIAGCAPFTGAAARFTLSLLTLKPGLFTESGRDLAGEVWLDDLGAGSHPEVLATAQLLGADQTLIPHQASGKNAAPHASHKGSFGDVAVLGGETTASASMAGAALLAASAALHAGAGRVMVALLGAPALMVDVSQPELMFRSPEMLDYRQQVIVCGCGGGELVKKVLPKVLSAATRSVLDADALNAIASDTSLQTLLAARQGRGYETVITPHPLEAARLLGSTTAQVQGDRLGAATALASRFNCVVVLKGSGTVIASPEQVPMVNPTGNALLATAGTGDVLAGMVGATMARGETAMQAACSAVFRHGKLADDWACLHPGGPLTASALARQVGA